MVPRFFCISYWQIQIMPQFNWKNKLCVAARVPGSAMGSGVMELRRGSVAQGNLP